MLPDSITVDGPEFAWFLEDNPDADNLGVAKFVEHEKLGRGVVTSVTTRQGDSPLFNVHFPNTNRLSKFNLSAFRSGMLARVVLDCDVRGSFLAWRAQVGQRAAEKKAAEKAATQRALRQREAAEAAAKVEAKRSLEARREQETQVVPFQSYMADIPRHASAMEQMERQSAARVSYNRDALLPRIKWLEEWALRGVAGEPGFEPSWSRGQVSAAYLKKNGISHLWHFTDIRNLEHICRARGLLSYEGVEALVEPDSKVWRSSNEESVRRDRFLGRQDSVRLSYIPNSFFFQRVRFASDLVWMRFSLSALSFNEVFYSQGNAASEYTNLSLHPGALTIDWRLLAEYGGGSNISDPPFFYPKWHPTSFDDPEFVRYKKASINSEILIKHFLSLDFCTGVWDVNKECWIELNRY